MERNERKIRVGKVVSDKMDKTIVVAVEYKNSISCIKSRSSRRLNLKPTMKTTNATLATSFVLKKPVRCPNRNTGES